MPKKYHSNPRQITKKQLDALRDSLARLGDLGGIVHNRRTDEIIGGNQRSEVINISDCQIEIVHRNEQPDEQGTLALGYAVWRGKRYNYRLVDWDDATAQEANIKANSLGGAWNWDVLANAFDATDLLNWGFDAQALKDASTAAAGIKALLDSLKPEPIADAEPQIDRAEELRSKWGVESGQLWRLGEHRIICGDCTDAATVARVMGGERADLCLTDPPYGIGKKAESGKNKYDEYDDTLENLTALAEKWLPIARELCKVVVFSPGVTNLWLYPQADWVMSWFYAGGPRRTPWGRGCWQPFLCYGNDPSLASGNGSRPDAISLNVPANSDTDHPCPKPLELWEWFINRLSFRIGEIFYEPFSGSGTTLIACERLNRKCRAIEISPGYVAVAIQRWVDATGGAPELLPLD